jgi:hypothetical protein
VKTCTDSHAQYLRTCAHACIFARFIRMKPHLKYRQQVALCTGQRGLLLFRMFPQSVKLLLLQVQVGTQLLHTRAYIRIHIHAHTMVSKSICERTRVGVCAQARECECARTDELQANVETRRDQNLEIRLHSVYFYGVLRFMHRSSPLSHIFPLACEVTGGRGQLR